MSRPPIKHIGIMRALCDGRKRANLRTDMSAEEYRRLGTPPALLSDEEPYRVCRACIKLAGDWRFLTWGKRRKPPRADRGRS